MRRFSIVVTGTPGTGKTTLCRKVSEIMGWVHMDLGEFVIRKRLHLGYDRSRMSYIVDLARTKRQIVDTLKSGEGTYLLDGCFSHLVAPLRNTLGVVVLRTNPIKLLERLSKKPKRKALENAQAEALDVVLIESLTRFGKVYEIDTTDKLVDEVVDEFLRAYDSGFPPKFGVTNWLQELHDDGNFDKIFGRVACERRT